jgi:hypothetical protein
VSRRGNRHARGQAAAGSEARFVEHVERIRRHFLALGVLSET